MSNLENFNDFQFSGSWIIYGIRLTSQHSGFKSTFKQKLLQKWIKPELGCERVVGDSKSVGALNMASSST